MSKLVSRSSSASSPAPLATGSLAAAALAALFALGAPGCKSDGPVDDGMGGAPSDGGGKSSGGSKSSGGASASGGTAAGGSAMGGEGGTPELTDKDGDGVTEEEGDCDDQNNRIFPKAEEVSDDGIDSNCDGDELPVSDLVWGAEGTDNKVDALKLLDTNKDGNVSLAEFAAACEKSAKLLGDARPGLVQIHASCAGNNSCKGMVYQSWNELYEHSCRGLNGCAGWSCVETAEDQKRDGAQAYEDAHCGYCHSPYDDNGEVVPGVFNVPVRPGEDEAKYVAEFWTSRNQEHLRSVVGFGVSGVTEVGITYTNMPGAYRILSLKEMDTLISYVKKMELKAHEIDPLATPSPMGGASSTE